MVTRAAEDSLGLPVALQLVALPWREELCLRVMTELERALPPLGSFCLSAVGSGGATAAIKETQIASDLAGPHHALAPEPRPCAVTNESWLGRLACQEKPDARSRTGASTTSKALSASCENRKRQPSPILPLKELLAARQT